LAPSESARCSGTGASSPRLAENLAERGLHARHRVVAIGEEGVEVRRGRDTGRDAVVGGWAPRPRGVDRDDGEGEADDQGPGSQGGKLGAHVPQTTAGRHTY
jgi:hypothetical protein